MARTIREIQQDFAENSGYRTSVIWDFYSAEKAAELELKLATLIPDSEKDQNAIVRTRRSMFQSIWAQRKYTNKNLLAAIIYILVTDEREPNAALQSTTFSCHPVFRTRKCTTNAGDSTGCCMIFIDEHGRVYQNWQSFLTDNQLPAGTMIAPAMGIYQFCDNSNIVKLRAHRTPASGLGSKLASATDLTSSVVGMCAATVSGVAVFTAVAAPVLAVATTAGLLSVGYTTLRSAFSLYDRSQHELTNDLRNAEARNNWLGVAGGAVGLGACGVTKLMQTAAAAGREISTVAQVVVNGVNITTILLSGSGVANGVLGLIIKYKDDEEITVLDVGSLSLSLFLFTHSVCNYRMASEIINEMRNNRIQSLRQNLSNRQRKMFDKLSKETIRVKGGTRGKIDIIRNANDINKQNLNDLYKINRQLNEHNVRPMFGAANEGILLNNELPVDTQALRNNLQHNVGANILEQVNNPIPSAHSELHSNSNAPLHLGTANRISPGNVKIIYRIYDGCIVAINLGNILWERISNETVFKQILLHMAEHYTTEVCRYLLDVSIKFINNFADKLEKSLQMALPSEEVLHQVVQMYIRKYKKLAIGTLQTLEKEFLATLKNYFQSLNANCNAASLVKCQICHGYYGVVAL